MVLRGTHETLRRHRPAVQFEIHPAWQPDGIDGADVESLIREARYRGQTLESRPKIRRQLWLPFAPEPAHAPL